MSASSLLTVENLDVSFETAQGNLQVIDDFSFEISEKETVGFVGESGAGKSVTWRSVTGLLNEESANISAERIEYRGEDLLNCSKQTRREVLKNEIGVIFQEPTESLNPTQTVGKQIREVITNTKGMSKSAARNEATDLMADVGIPSPEDRYSSYPHEFSGGMNQRIMIAIALARDPNLLIADEPTSALDVTIQAQILDILKEKREKYDLSVLYITHDLNVISEISDRVVIVYAGEPVEKASIDNILRNPAHPYTVKLIDSIPRLNDERKYLSTIGGSMPKFHDSVPDQCKFCDRCDEVFEECKRQEPGLIEINDGHQVRCFLYE